MEGSKIAVLYTFDFAAQDRPQSSIFNFSSHKIQGEVLNLDISTFSFALGNCVCR
jgi:hypothetical protein